MLKFGESYVVTLKNSIVLPDGQWKHCIYGDYKGTHKCEVTDNKYVQIGEVSNYTVNSYIGNAYGVIKGKQ